MAGRAPTCCASSPRRRTSRSRPSASRARCTARCSSTRTAGCCGPPCCGTTPAPGPSAARSSAGSARSALIAITGNAASAGFQAPEDPVAARARARGLRRASARPAAQGLHPLPPHRRGRDRRLGRLGHAAPRPRRPPLQRRDPGRPRHSAAWLPAVHESADVTGRVSDEAAAATGLQAGTPVVAGGGDNACAAIGAGIIAEGQGAISLGTSGTIFLRSERPVVDPKGALNAFCDAAGGWHLMGVILSAGGSLRWFTDAVTPAEVDVLRRAGLDPFAVLVDQALTLPPGADGLLFLPYLAGERSPHMDPQARGAWVGPQPRPRPAAHAARRRRGRRLRARRLPRAHARAGTRAASPRPRRRRRRTPPGAACSRPSCARRSRHRPPRRDRPSEPRS